jgi:hypothetical protein
MKEDWLERRKRTALAEFEAAREELQALREKTRNPIESQVINGILFLVEFSIMEASMAESPLPRWYRKVVYSLANPFINSKYRKFIATLRKFDFEEMVTTPAEILEDAEEWKGDPDAGLFTLEAQHYATELSRTFNGEFIRDLQEAVDELANSGADPSSAPGSSELAWTWEKLPDAIAFADIACELLSNAPESPANEIALQYAEAIRDRLGWVQTCLQLRRAATRKLVAGPDGTDLDVTTLGRDLYHNHIRREIDLKKGDFVVIDVTSGDYEVGDSETEVWMRLKERRPEAITWVEQVGFPTPYKTSPRLRSRGR